MMLHLDANGTNLQVGDQAKVKLSSFDGPTHLISMMLIVAKLGRTKLHVRTTQHSERTWAVTASTLELIQTAQAAKQQATERLATIARAVTHMESADPAVLRDLLATTTLHEKWRQNPAALADSLRNVDSSDWAALFGSWKGAQKVLHAAGLPT